MSNYTITNKTLNPNRVFILQKSELEKRLDPFYYIPELLKLEKKVLAKKPKKLRDYVQSLASGATPKTTENEKYYAEKQNGIPFLRVQNLSPTGVLEFEDCKYINKETHHGMLKRSQVLAGDLLVKITGVGRMAVASVAPDAFEGNINQHVCVIKTGNKEVSETLAAFLNSDIGEKLASRRSTGGTRPALDYTALLSIPIIEDKRILQITEKVIAKKQANEAQAEKLLARIDDYLLAELGITLPTPPENTLKNRMFIANFNDIESRLDPHFYLTHFIELEKAIRNSPNKVFRLDDIFEINRGGSPRPIHDFMTEDENGVNWIKIGDTKNDNKYIYQTADKIIPEGAKYSRKVEVGDFILSNSMSFGRPYIMQIEGYIHDGWLLFKPKLDEFNADYFHSILSSKLMFKLFKKATIGGVVENLNIELVKKISIPIPPLSKQKEIAEYITNIRQQAQQLKNQSTLLLKEASEQIEAILLN
ncbi:MAG: restriction endonuclease subunit S [Ferruginibacter sp.]|nr:restriction endonuclease subunit S [Ferruginibacter sp.]